MRKLSFILTIIFIGFVPAGCKKDLAAKVNGEKITMEEFNSLLKEARRHTADASQKRDFLEGVIQRELMAQMAEKLGLDEDPAVTAKIKNYKRQLLSQMYEEKVLKEKLTDEELKKYFDENKERLSEERVKVAHILLRVPYNSTPEDDRKAQQKAKEVYLLAKGGKDFVELAKKYSEDEATKNNGGQLGFISRNQLTPEFTEKAFSMKQGEVSEPVKTRFGYHVIKVLEGPQKFTPDFNSIKARLRFELQKRVIEETNAELRKRASIWINEDAFGKKDNGQ